MVASGVVFLQAGHERRIPVKNVRVAAEVVDFVSEVKVTQVFENVERMTVEAHYVFPIDAGAAVNGLEIKVDGRVIKGVVREKEEAKRAYTTAKAMGHGAYLLQENEATTDVFKTSLGNLRPGSMVEVTISYVAEVPMEGPSLRFTLPAAVAPRYTYSKAQKRAKARTARHRRPAPAAGAGTAAMDATSVSLDFVATFSLPSEVTSVTSPSHASQINVELGHDDKPSVARVAFHQDERVHLDQDLVLIVSQAQANRPHAFVETLANDAVEAGKAGGEERKVDTSTAVLVGVYPDATTVGADDDDGADQACEVVFVVDRSGSMRGDRMDAAKQALQVCLRSLPEGSLFQIVSFGSRHTKLFEGGSKAYNDATLSQATRHVDGMSANYGGTEILNPLQDVFSNEADPAKPRQVLLFTDGQVSDTASVIQLVKNQYAKTGVRCFVFGIGSGVSHALVDGVSKASGGAAEYIHGNEELTAKVMRQLGRALEPAITHCKVDWGELKPFVEASTPVKVKAAHSGTRVTFYARMRGEWPAADVSLMGELPTGPVKWTIRVTPPGQYAAGGGAVTHVVGRTIHTAYGRNRIRDLELLNVPAAKAVAVDIGTEFGVASKWTSFVAIEYRDDAGAAGDGADTPVRTVGSMTQVNNVKSHDLRRHLLGRGGGRGRGSGAKGKRRRAKASYAAPAATARSLVGQPLRGGAPGHTLSRNSRDARSGAALRKRSARPRAAVGAGYRAEMYDARAAAQGFLAPPPPALAPAGGALVPPPPAGLVRQTSAERAAAAGNLFAAVKAEHKDASAKHMTFDDESDDDSSSDERMSPRATMESEDVVVGDAFAGLRLVRSKREGRKGGPSVPSASRQRSGGRARPAPAPTASAPAAASAPVASGGSIDAIVRAQKANGTWSLATVAALVPGKSAAGVRGSAPAGTPDDAWATALMLAVLKLHFAAKRAEWGILARKARRALTAALGEAMADVAAAAEAFVMG